MKADKGEFLRLLNLPARLTITEAAWFLGFTETDISALISAGLWVAENPSPSKKQRPE